MRPLLPLTLLALLPATPAFAAHWQYGPSTRVETRTGHEYAPRDAMPPFALDAHRANAEEIALAQLVLERSGDERVRRFAESMIDFSRRLDADLGFRGTDAGWADPREFDRLRGPELDVAYLERAMDVHDAIRPEFAAFKERTGGSMHRLLCDDWDRLVELREWAKPLHDRIRNDARERERGRDRDRDRGRSWRYDPDS